MARLITLWIRPPDFEFVGLVDDGWNWKAKETLEQAVAKKERMKNRYRNPRRGYINDGQGIGTDYSRWLENHRLTQISVSS